MVTVFLYYLGPILTGGIKVGGIWMWEKVSKESNGKEVERTRQVPIEESIWFPGINISFSKL